MPLRIKYQTVWGGDGGNGAAGELALLMKEPQSVTRLYFSCLRVFHGRRQEGERTAQALRWSAEVTGEREGKDGARSKQWLLNGLHIHYTARIKTFIRGEMLIPCRNIALLSMEVIDRLISRWLPGRIVVNHVPICGRSMSCSNRNFTICGRG